MSETVFADSFFYLALLNPSDEFHEQSHNAGFYQTASFVRPAVARGS